MTVTVEFLAISIGLLITIASFIYSRYREAENRGRLLQRIDNLEKTLEEMRARHREADDRLGCHDNDIVKITGEIESLRDIIERIDKKLDRVLERSGQ